MMIEDDMMLKTKSDHTPTQIQIEIRLPLMLEILFLILTIQEQVLEEGKRKGKEMKETSEKKTQLITLTNPQDQILWIDREKGKLESREKTETKLGARVGMLKLLLINLLIEYQGSRGLWNPSAKCAQPVV